MIPMSAAAISEIVHGELRGSGSLMVTAAPTLDSRNVKPGSLFLALKGKNVDGHDFAEEAIGRGATLVLASKPLDVPSILVEDVEKAIGQLAQHLRNSLANLTVIAITGSQGKTTTKDLLAWTLRLVGPTVATIDSLNNELGLPLTLLNCDESTRFCVVEMGARHEGDIALLCKIARPDIGVVLNVGSAHVGEFGSREAIARTKAELFENIKAGGIAISGQYDSYTSMMFDNISEPLHESLTSITFGETSQAQVRSSDIDMRDGRAHFDLVTPDGRAAVALRLIGEHQVSNALATAAVCSALNIPIEIIATGLSTSELASRWRMEVQEISDLLFINDSYNANPESVSAALKTLALFGQTRGGQTWAFLGRMHELGSDETRQHRQIGSIAGDLGIDHVVCVKTPEYAADVSSFPEMTIHIADSSEEAADFARHFSHGDAVLIKGSRAEKMEELSEALINNWVQRVSSEE